MTVSSGGLYVTELLDGLGQNGNFRVDQFGLSNSKPVKCEFSSQLAQPEELDKGIAFGSASGEEEMYLGQESGPASVAVFGAGLCGSLECATLQHRWTGEHTPRGSFDTVLDVAVDNSASAGDWASGDLFVVDNGAPNKVSVVDIFKPVAGGGEPGKIEGQLTGVSPSEPFAEPSHIAVSGFNGDVVVQDGASDVDLFEPAAVGEYVFVRRLVPPAGEFESGVMNVAIDGGHDGMENDGEIYVATESAVDEFGPEGTFRGSIRGTSEVEESVLAGPFGSRAAEPHSVAVDPVSHTVFVGVFNSNARIGAVDVFAPDLVVPDVVTDSVSGLEVEPERHAWGVQLHGTVDPDNAGPATCSFVWGTSRSFGHVAPCTSAVQNGAATVGVEARISGLEPDTTYFYRLQAENANGKNTGEIGQDMTFTTPGPGLRGESVAEVSSSSARLLATMNPDGAATSYRFEYDTSAYTQGGPSHGERIPLTGASIGEGSKDVEVEQHVQGLQIDTTYHYRVVATSEVEVAPETAPGEVQAEEFDSSDQTFVTQPSGAPLTLIDGRAWELVSPVDKHGSLILPVGESGLAQAAAVGDAFTYQVSLPTENEPRGYVQEEQVLSSRGANGGWSSVDVALPHRVPTGILVGTGPEYRFFSEDLGFAVAEAFGPFSAPEGEVFPEATEGTPYLRNNLTCAGEHATCYTPLVTAAAEGGDVPEDTVFGGDVRFVGATPDASHVLLGASAGLGAAPGLYEWSAGDPAGERLQLVSMLPAVEGGKAAVDAQLGDYHGVADVARRAVSDDGSRVFFSAGVPNDEHLFMRDVRSGTSARLDLAEGGLAAPNVPALFQTASADGSKAFFTDTAGLTAGSGTLGSDLYVCGMTEASCDLLDLTAVPKVGQPGAGENAQVQGVLGASEDGSYVYFVANGVLASGASSGDCEEGLGGGTCNLYVAHESGGAWSTRFITRLSGDDSPDWARSLNEATAGASDNGMWLAFMSDRSLTGYDNHDAVSGMLDEEVYLYSAASGELTCASCDPTGARPIGVEYSRLNDGPVGGDRIWSNGQWLAANIPGWTPFNLGKALYQPRFLSDKGRLFFDSSDALSPQDINGNEDVYEYEPKGVSSCEASTVTFSSGADGCIGLISSGVAFGESGFLDASEGGSDVFFLTAEKLVAKDVDTAFDVYDAHECTSVSPCSGPEPTVAGECISAAACRPAPLSQPSIYGAPSSATFTGSGNVTHLPKPKAKARKLSRAEKLAKALKECNKKRVKAQRAVCKRQARRRYEPASALKKALVRRALRPARPVGVRPEKGR
jgi:hypothetical protein